MNELKITHSWLKLRDRFMTEEKQRIKRVKKRSLFMQFQIIFLTLLFSLLLSLSLLILLLLNGLGPVYRELTSLPPIIHLFIGLSPLAFGLLLGLILVSTSHLRLVNVRNYLLWCIISLFGSFLPTYITSLSLNEIFVRGHYPPHSIMQLIPVFPLLFFFLFYIFTTAFYLHHFFTSTSRRFFLLKSQSFIGKEQDVSHKKEPGTGFLLVFSVLFFIISLFVSIIALFSLHFDTETFFTFADPYLKAIIAGAVIVFLLFELTITNLISLFNKHKVILFSLLFIFSYTFSLLPVFLLNFFITILLRFYGGDITAQLASISSLAFIHLLLVFLFTFKLYGFLRKKELLKKQQIDQEDYTLLFSTLH